MESIQHLKISVIASPVLAVFAFGKLQIPEFFALSLLGIAVGTLIDLDHFVLERYRSGTWSELKKAIENPQEIITDNASVRDPAITSKDRYISHLMILWAAQFLLFFSAELGLFTVSMIGIHILSDLYASARDRGQDQESSEKQSQD
jgi:hypothetical protein